MEHVVIRNISFAEIIRTKIPKLQLGMIYASGVKVTRNSSLVAAEYHELSDFIKQKFKEKAPSSDKIVSAVRRMYRRIGWEPTRYRPSSEAMIRRIIKNIGLYNISNMVDLGNVASTRFHLPMGLYDVDKIIGTITIDVGREGESYQGISKDLIHAAGKMILRDEEGIFGNPTADSKRTRLTANTGNVLAIFFTPPEVSSAYLSQTLQFLADLYKQECIQCELMQKIIICE